MLKNAFIKKIYSFFSNSGINCNSSDENVRLIEITSIIFNTLQKYHHVDEHFH